MADAIPFQVTTFMYFRPEMSESFLFVNHDAQTVGVRINRGAVNAHVQFQYHKRNHDKSRRLSRNSLRSTRLRPLRAIGSEQTLKPLSGAAHSSDLERSVRSQTATDDSDVISDSASSLPSPLTFLQKGNTDPFSALAITISPTISALLAWHRHIGLSALYPIESQFAGLPSTAMRRTWQDLVTALHHPSQVYPFLSVISTFLARRTKNEEMTKVSLFCKDHSYRLLRMRIEEKREVKTVQTYNVILWLFWAEMGAGYYAEAGVHLKMLANLLESHGNSNDFDVWWCERLLVADVVFAMWGMTRPLFDVERWSFEEAYQDWRQDIRFSVHQAVEKNCHELDVAIADPGLRAIFTGLRELLYVREQLATHVPTSSSIFRWMDARLLSSESKLIGLYVDAQSPGQEGSDKLAADSIELAYTCLAAISLTGSVFGSSYRHQADHMASKLRNAIISRDRDTSQAPRWPRLRLWALFVGASLEGLDKSDSSVGSSKSKWHSRALTMQARSLGLSSWGEIRGVLQGFLYSDLMNRRSPVYYW